jgi:hypothetical protein
LTNGIAGGGSTINDRQQRLFSETGFRAALYGIRAIAAPVFWDLVDSIKLKLEIN